MYPGDLSEGISSFWERGQFGRASSILHLLGLPILDGLEIGLLLV